jgi:hypothetical protein
MSYIYTGMGNLTVVSPQDTNAVVATLERGPLKWTPPVPGHCRVGQFLQVAPANSHNYEVSTPILLNEEMSFTAVHRLSVGMTSCSG